MVSPATVQVVAPVVVQVPLPGLEVTVYPVTAAPPLLAGAVQLIEAEVDKVVATAVTPVGGLGDVAGTTGAEAADAGPVPTPLVAVTVKV